MMDWPDPVLRVALIAYRILMWLLTPAIIIYLFVRGRKDPLYQQDIAERFGFAPTTLSHPVWIHAVSLGELRSAVPLIQAILKRGDHVLITCFTPAGKRAAIAHFGEEIALNTVQVVWVPLELRGAYKRFLRSHRPRLGMVMEIEVWPMMIAECHNAAMPLYMCNAQYPEKSVLKDARGLRLRARLFGGFAGGFVKSKTQADRLRSAGLKNIAITGELRFDQPIPKWQLDAAQTARPILAKGREVITLTSVVEGEDATYIEAMQAASDPLYIYVPRAPERFEESVRLLEDAGLKVGTRSALFDADLNLKAPADIDVLVGDSMGEMYFYLALCDRAIVGGGFVPKGAHNIIEPLALKKPVIVGPHIWTITYPADDAIAAGVCTKVETVADLISSIRDPKAVTETQITTFFDTHSGGVARTIKAMENL